MAAMDSSNSVSSCESLYSVESEEEEEEQQQHRGDFEVFSSDSGSDTEKESVPPRQEVRSGGGDLFFSPRSGRTNPALLCRDRKHRFRKPLGSSSSAKPPSVSACRRYPVALEDMYCDHLMDTEGSPLRQAAGPKRLEGGCGRKRLSNTLRVGLPPQLSPRGKKRQRKEEEEDREGLQSATWTEKDHLFAQKCWELQGFIRPLMELLHRLRMGRFNQGLSSFQQSVAMDRIQRIIGVLQKPEMGERYLDTLLQVERMLKVWFPQIALKNSCADRSAEAAEKKCETSKSSTVEKARDKRAESTQDSPESPARAEVLQTPPTDAPEPLPRGKEPLPCFLGDWPAMNLTWVHTSPISNPPLGHVDFGRADPAPLRPEGGLQPYGVVVFLGNPAASLLTAGPSLPGSGEPPRCQSLPSTVMAGGSPARGAFGCLSRSLPDLPAVSEGPPAAPQGRPRHHRAS